MRRRHELRGQVKYLNVHESSPMMITVHSPLYTFMIYIYYSIYFIYTSYTPSCHKNRTSILYTRVVLYIISAFSTNYNVVPYMFPLGDDVLGIFMPTGNARGPATFYIKYAYTVIINDVDR